MGLEVVALGIVSALSMASAAYGIKSQNDQAQAAGESANTAAAADYQAVSAAGEQVNAQASAEALKLKRQALIERGRLVATQSETGFFGNSPLREMLVARLKEKEGLGAIGVNQANALVQNSRDANKVFTSNMSRYNEAMSRRTNSAAAGLMIASAGIQGGVEGYTLGKALTEPKRGRG